MIFVCALSVLFFVILWMLVCESVRIMRTKLPGPTAYPFIGVFSTIHQLVRSYDQLVAVRIGTKLLLLVYNANDIVKILHSPNNQKSMEYQYLKPWLGDGLISGSGSKYKMHKKLMMPMFATKYLLNYFEIYNKNARKFVDLVQNFADGRAFDLQPIVSEIAMCTILETSLGISADDLDINIAQYVQTIERLSAIAQERTYKFWLRPDWIFHKSSLKKEQDKLLDVVNPITMRVIAKRKSQITNNNAAFDSQSKNGAASFVDNMLQTRDEYGAGLNDEEIRDEVMTIMFAGQDTTAMTIGFALCLLGIHTDVQEKLYAEIVENFGPAGGNPDASASASAAARLHVDHASLTNCPYLDCVLNETLRLYPPVPLLARTAASDIHLDTGDYAVPKGSTVAVLLMFLHRNKLFFSNPDKFNPDNFNASNTASRHPYAFMPFSTGNRPCIGKKYAMYFIKICLIHMIRKYKITSLQRESDFQLSAQITLKKNDGFPLCIKQRH